MEIAGSFSAGDAVEVRAAGGNSRPIGKGIVNYSAEELARIRGLKSDAVLEVFPRAAEEAVHRDYFVLVRLASRCAIDALRSLLRYDREIVGLAVPALGALAAEPLYLLADTAMVGHLGTPELAALAIAGTLITGASRSSTSSPTAPRPRWPG